MQQHRNRVPDCVVHDVLNLKFILMVDVVAGQLTELVRQPETLRQVFG